MFTDLILKPRRVLAGLLCAVLSVAYAQTLPAQTSAATDEVLQANTALASQVNSGAPLTANTRATLIARHERLIELFVTHPELARAHALDAKTRASLLSGGAPVQTFPVAIPDIAPGGSISTLFDFPASVGSPGSGSVIKFAGTYTGGNFSGSTRVTLPTTPATN